MEPMTNDPQFTAYALGEMSPEEARNFHASLMDKGISPEEVQKEVEELKDIQLRLSEEFSKDKVLRLSPEKRKEAMGLIEKKKPFFLAWPSSSKQFGVLFILIILPVSLMVIKDRVTQRSGRHTEGVFDGADSWIHHLNHPAPTASRPESSFYLKGSSLSKKAKSLSAPTAAYAPREKEEFNREGYDHIEASDYISVQSQPLSTFSIDVDTASYANVRRFLENGSLPKKHAVRVEELINYFPYEYEMDHSDHPIGVKVDQVESPFHAGRRLVRVAMKAAIPKVQAHKNLVFLLDVSGSMKAVNKLPLLKESIKILLRELKPSDTISLVVYAGAAGVVLEPTPASERVKILNALNKLNTGGSTNGGAGIKAAYDLAKIAFKEDGINRVILATDGDFNVGTSHRGGLVDMVKAKAKENIFLTVLGFGMGNYQDGMLEEISNKGNGNYAYIDNLSEANKVFKHDLEKNMTIVAKDVKIQVEFNPKHVQAYRLIGYENRTMAAQDFNDDKKDAGEIGAGHTVTALYEVVGHDEKMPLPKVDELKYGKPQVVANNDSQEILNVKVRYKEPTKLFSTKFEVPLKQAMLSELKGDKELLFAISVAAFGLKLRSDEMAKNVTYKDIESWASRSKGKDELSLRSEFIDLVKFADSLSK